MVSHITQAAAYWIREPLHRPYELAFGSLEAFNLLIVRVVDDDGSIAYGESCPVPPYSHETAEEVWTTVSKVLPELIHADPRSVLHSLRVRSQGAESFAYVAPTTAVESLVYPATQDDALVVPVVGAVQAHTRADLVPEIRRLTALGYGTLKVKVGFDPEEDAYQVSVIQENIDDDVRLRLDANEGWTAEQAASFLKHLDPAHIELLEQPFPRARWDWTRDLVNEHHPVPLMLDESIQGEESIGQAADIGVSFVKLKLMKTGSRLALQERMQLAQELGLSTIIGNGIAGVVDNWYEALCACGNPWAGEMNGNLKTVRSVFSGRPFLRDGQLQFPAGFGLAADQEELVRRSQRALVL